MSLLSAIVPVSSKLTDSRNLEAWISKIEQSEVQVVLVLDAPNQQLSKIQKQLKENFSDSRATFVTGDFGNPGSARNEGMRIATGEWIVFWDSDDLPNVQQTINLLTIHSKKDFELLIQDYSINTVPQNSIQHIKMVDGNSSELLANLSYNPGIWRLIFRRDSISNITFPKLLMAEDQLFLAEIEPWKRKILYTGVENYQYFKGVAGQLTSNTQAISDLLISTNVLISKIINHDGDQVGIEFLSNMLFRQMTTSFIRGDLSLKIRITMKALILPTKIKRLVTSAGIKYLKLSKESFR